MRNLVTVVWLVYPVWWLVGSEGLGLVGIGIETAGFMVIDLVAKVGFGIILLRSHGVLDGAAETTGTGATPETTNRDRSSSSLYGGVRKRRVRPK